MLGTDRDRLGANGSFYTHTLTVLFALPVSLWLVGVLSACIVVRQLTQLLSVFFEPRSGFAVDLPASLCTRNHAA
jgi:hypothetical protein